MHPPVVDWFGGIELLLETGTVLEGILHGVLPYLMQRCNECAGVQVASYSFTFPGDDNEQQVHPLGMPITA